MYSTQASVGLTDRSRLGRIIIITVLRFLHLLLFAFIFDKLKTGPRTTLFSDERLLNGHLYQEAICLVPEGGRLIEIRLYETKMETFGSPAEHFENSDTHMPEIKRQSTWN